MFKFLALIKLKNFQNLVQTLALVSFLYQMLYLQLD